MAKHFNKHAMLLWIEGYKRVRELLINGCFLTT
jgi:hypothetical protein